MRCQHQSSFRYNIGIVHLAERDFAGAAAAFDAAYAARPSLAQAAVRTKTGKGRREKLETRSNDC